MFCFQLNELKSAKQFCTCTVNQLKSDACKQKYKCKCETEAIFFSWNGDTDHLRMPKRQSSRLQYNSLTHKDQSTGILPT